MRIPIYRPEEDKFQLMELDTDHSSSESPSTPSSSESDSRLTTPEHSDTESETEHPETYPSRDPPQPRLPPPPPFDTLLTFILVIGGLGYLGSHTALELLRSGHNVLIIDSLTTTSPTTLTNLLALLDLHHSTSTPSPTNPPILRFHRLDYRSRALPALLESYSDLVMTIDTSGTQRMAPRSRITGVVHLAPLRGGDDVSRLMRRLGRGGMGGVVVLGGWDGDGVAAVTARDGPAGRVVVMRCKGAVVGCDGSGLLGWGPRGAPTAAELGTGDDFLHVLDVARAFVAALDWGGGGETGVRVVDLGLRGRDGREGAEEVVGKLMGGEGVYVARGGPVWRPRGGVARSTAGKLWKLVRRW